jgi:hypothetical protein
MFMSVWRLQPSNAVDCAARATSGGHAPPDRPSSALELAWLDRRDTARTNPRYAPLDASELSDGLDQTALCASPYAADGSRLGLLWMAVCPPPWAVFVASSWVVPLPYQPRDMRGSARNSPIWTRQWA